jgi:multidrug efflux pump subunit AcrB
LAALADFSFGAGPTGINRHDRRRQANVQADLVPGKALSQASAAVHALPMMKKENLPPGVTVLEGGDAELQEELFDGFGQAMRDGLTMVYLVLALLFGSLLQPLTILFSLPLSVAGAMMALILANLAITTPVVIGILMLMGIVSKNAIMLVDFAVEAIHKGVDRTAAIIDAGQKRARPIVMTTIAMAAGMAPSALGLGMGGEFRSPMAIAVIGGLLVSTFLSLLFVPAFFTMMDDLGHLSSRLFSRFIGPTDETEPAHATPIAAEDAHGEQRRKPEVVRPAVAKVPAPAK